MNSKEKRYVVRLWDNQVVNCSIIRELLCLSLVNFKIQYWNDGKPTRMVYKVKWYPSWRVFEVGDE